MLVTASALAFGLVTVTVWAALDVEVLTLPNDNVVGTGGGSAANTFTLTKPPITFADASLLEMALEPTDHTPVVLLLLRS
jgi:hypothetical protein